MPLVTASCWTQSQLKAAACQAQPAPAGRLYEAQLTHAANSTTPACCQCLLQLAEEFGSNLQQRNGTWNNTSGIVGSYTGTGAMMRKVVTS